MLSNQIQTLREQVKKLQHDIKLENKTIALATLTQKKYTNDDSDAGWKIFQNTFKVKSKSVDNRNELEDKIEQLQIEINDRLRTLLKRGGRKFRRSKKIIPRKKDM
jgi:hypothetical protein